MKLTRFISLIVFVFLLPSCDKEAETINTMDKGRVLAEVNGKAIYEQELKNTLIDMFGEYKASTLDVAAREKALQSLVASRAMVDITLKEIDARQLAQIEEKSKRYRDNLLINAHVKKNMLPEPISNAMIESYYKDHLENFGQKAIRQYELLFTKDALPPEVRDKFFSAFEKVRTLEPKKIQQQLKKQGFDMQYHKGVTGENVLEPKIRDFIQAQELKVLSSVTFIDGKVYVALIDSDITQPAKPLSTVRDSVRKSLAMVQLKKAVKDLSETALKQAKIIYHDVK